MGSLPSTVSTATRQLSEITPIEVDVSHWASQGRERTHVHVTERWLRVANLARVEVEHVEAASCGQDLISRSTVDVGIEVQSPDPGLLVGAVHADAWRVLGCRLWSS